MPGSDRYRAEPPDIITKIQDLEARVSRMERSPRLTASAIDANGIDILNGAIRARDADGNIVAQFGKQDDNSYGITVLENGEMVPPAALLNHYVYAASVFTQETYTSTSFGDLTTVGPRLTIPVRSTGRLLVFVTSQIQWVSPAFASSVAAGGFVTISMDGNANFMNPVTAAAAILPSFNITHTVSPGTIADANQVTATGTAVFDGLNPGDTTITVKYANQIASTSIDYGRRTLIIITL